MPVRISHQNCLCCFTGLTFEIYDLWRNEPYLVRPQAVNELAKIFHLQGGLPVP